MSTTNEPSLTLAECRSRIDQIDKQLLELFQERMRIADHVAEAKRAMGRPVYDPVRERERIQTMTELSDPQYAEAVGPLWLTLMELSRARQHAILDEPFEAIDCELRSLGSFTSIACQGVLGGYAQQASEALLPHARMEFAPTWEEVCERVSNGTVELGILPLEKSTAGSVDRVYDLLARGNLFITGSVRLRVHDDLLAKPGTKLSSARETFPHEQAIRESQRFICVVSRPYIDPEADRSSLLLILPHQPGSLYRALARIAALGINMVNLESRPIPDSRFEFMVYVDIEETIRDASVQSLISQLNAICEKCVFLGSYTEVEA